MDEPELREYIRNTPILTRWHFYGYHFEKYLRGEPQSFAASLVDALLVCDRVVPGFATRMVDALASKNSRERWQPHYWQLMQRLAEVLVCKRLVECFPEAVIRWDDLRPRSRKKERLPDFLVELGARTIAIEVKAPDLGEHRKTRTKNLLQVSARGVLHRDHARQLQDVTLPRDNPVKDFLVSAQAKFEVERTLGHEKLETVLIIVWDSYAYEAITALVGPSSGLLTERSFATDSEGRALAFDAVGGVIVTQHLSVLITEAGEGWIPTSATHALDFGQPMREPRKVFMEHTPELAPDREFLDCFQTIDPLPGTEFGPVEIVHWLE